MHTQTSSWREEAVPSAHMADGAPNLILRAIAFFGMSGPMGYDLPAWMDTTVTIQTQLLAKRRRD